MRVLKAQLSDPPPGPFDVSDLCIHWVEDEDGVQAAAIPSSRFRDFLKGEESRGVTQYWHRDRNRSEQASYADLS